jgi:hypothetical protein
LAKGGGARHLNLSVCIGNYVPGDYHAGIGAMVGLLSDGGVALSSPYNDVSNCITGITLFRLFKTINEVEVLKHYRYFCNTDLNPFS